MNQYNLKIILHHDCFKWFEANMTSILVCLIFVPTLHLGQKVRSSLVSFIVIAATVSGETKQRFSRLTMYKHARVLNSRVRTIRRSMFEIYFFIVYLINVLFL